jgi:hypothetical protein
MASILGNKMMLKLALPRHRRARIWFGEALPAGFIAVRTLQKEFPTESFVPTMSQVAAVELAIPRGAMTAYGLLGGEVVADDRRRADVEVSINQDGPDLADSLAVAPDQPRVGLLEEYGFAACAGIEHVVRQGWQFNGEVRLRWAAHSTIGSSPMVFEELGTILAQLLSMTALPSEAALVSLLSG